MADLQDRLAAALGATYRIEQELGGGGMSRVFLAEELELGRQVVIKVLPPEMAPGVNRDRFRREIQLAARLQHPHVVPVLTAGEASGLLYYVMPYIKGESLQAKLAREGELPVVEAVRILRELTDALAYAHSAGVVHRDIKPANILLSGAHALVTDFGVAKAVSVSTGDHSITSMGLAIGTPAYMAPEQASGDGHVDHRADLYALGATAFEMLTGRPPFVAESAQALLGAHLHQTPERVTVRRPAVPAVLDGVIARCLEKRAADRWQHATELQPYFDVVLGQSSGAGTTPVTAAYVAADPSRPAAPAPVSGALTVAPPTLSEPHRRPKRRLAIAGGMAVATAVVYLGMRVLGIGPVGTLLASGALAERDRIVLAELENRTPDSALATTVTELLRTDLAQSRAVSMYDVAQLSEVLQQMQLPAGAPVSFAVARDAATRQGLKAVLAGEITALGKGYVISARLVATTSGELLWTGRESAADADGLSAAVDRLSTNLRQKVGESLRTIRADPPLADATTRSTEALRLFTQADRANDAGDVPGAVALLEQAVALDSTFGMAYRRLGVLARGRGRDSTANLALQRAWSLRERLTTRERYLVEATYHGYITHDTTKAIAAYRTLLDAYPDDRTALNNLATIYERRGKRAEALDLYRSAVHQGVAAAVTFTNAIPLEVQLGHRDSAGVMIQAFGKAYPDNPAVPVLRAQWLMSGGRLDSAGAILDARRAAAGSDTRAQLLLLEPSLAVALGSGHVAQAESLLAAAARQQASLVQLPKGMRWTAQDFATARVLAYRADIALQILGDTAAAARLLDQSTTIVPWEMRPPVSTSLLTAASSYANANVLATAQAYWHKWEAIAHDSDRTNLSATALAARAAIARADGRPVDALHDWRAARDKRACNSCYVDEMAAVFVQTGHADSAIIYLERARADSTLGVVPSAPRAEALAHLYESRGDKAHAAINFQVVIDLWKDAPSPLQKRVEAARAALMRVR